MIALLNLLSPELRTEDSKKYKEKLEELQTKVDEAALATLNMNRLFYLNYDSNKYMTVCNFLFDADDKDVCCNW